MVFDVKNCRYQLQEGEEIDSSLLLGSEKSKLIRFSLAIEWRVFDAWAKLHSLDRRTHVGSSNSEANHTIFFLFLNPLTPTIIQLQKQHLTLCLHTHKTF